MLIIIEDSIVVSDDNKPSKSFSPSVVEMVGKIDSILGKNYRYIDDGKTDNESFTGALAQSGKHK